MPHLRVFDFMFYTSSSSDNDIKGYIAQIDQFNSPFWFEREWALTLESGMKKSSLRLFQLGILNQTYFIC